VQSAPAPVLDLFKESNRQVLIDTFDGINAFRATKGLKPLKFNVNIAAVSQRWSDTMAETGSFMHNGDYITGTPEGWASASENIAWYTYAPSGQRFVDMWINSPGHNANMSRPDDQYMGIGISSVDGRYYATANHFRYQDGVVPPGSYDSPRDFFNGLPELGPGSVVIANALEPVWDAAGRTYTIPGVPGVEYRLYSGADQGVVKAPGTYPATGYTAISASAKPGYRLSNFVAYWDRTFDAAQVTAQAPVFDKAARAVTIPSSPGVQYLLNGVIVPAGTHPFHETAKVEARALSGYALTGTSIWSLTVPLIAVSVTTAPVADKTAGTYTIPSQVGVQFFIDNKPVPAGTYKSSADVAVSAQATTGYTLTGTTQWVLHPGLETVYASGPLFVDYSNLFLIPDQAGVQYYLNGKDVAGGRYTGTGKVVVTAAAKPGYRLADGAASWSHDYTPPLVKVTASAPTFNRTTGKYTIPARTGVTYLVNGAVKVAGTYASRAKITVTAKSAAGYVLTGTASWSYNLAPQAVTAAAPVFNRTTGKYTIPARAGVAYAVNGKTTAGGTYKANGRLVTVTAKAAAGYVLSGTASWKGDFRKAVTPARPAMNAATNRYTIPRQTGVAFYVNGKLTGPGTYKAVNGRVVAFTAKASASTYRLTGTAAWSYRF
jgi:hypothetical protein